MTPQAYESGTPDAGHDASWAEWEAVLWPPDGDVFVVGNHVHDCHYGLGLKNISYGPYHFVSNYIHDVDYGVFSPFRETTVRNNVIHNADRGIQLGTAETQSPLNTYLMLTGNGAHSEVSYNTIVGGGLWFHAGWGTQVHHNLVVDTAEPIAVARNQFAWWNDGGWPGIRGEFLVGDLDASHYLWERVPGYVRERPNEFRRMELTSNCYTAEPAIGRVDFVQPEADITGRVFDEDPVMLSEAQRSGLFVDESEGDYTRTDDEFECGAGIAVAMIPGGDAGPGPSDAGRRDAGMGVDGGPMASDAMVPGADGSARDAGPNFDGGPNVDGGPEPTHPDGCAVGRSPHVPAPWWLGAVMLVIGWRRVVERTK